MVSSADIIVRVPDQEFDGVPGLLLQSNTFNSKGLTFGEPPSRSAKLYISDGPRRARVRR